MMLFFELDVTFAEKCSVIGLFSPKFLKDLMINKKNGNWYILTNKVNPVSLALRQPGRYIW